MSSISIKGVLVGGVFDFIVAGFGAMIVTFIFTRITGAVTTKDLSAALEAQPVAILWTSVLTIMTVLVIAAGGYLAAKVAGKGPLINATLSTFASVLSGLYALAMRPDNWISCVISIAAAPLLGLLGGYLYKRRRNFLQVRA